MTLAEPEVLSNQVQFLHLTGEFYPGGSVVPNSDYAEDLSIPLPDNGQGRYLSELISSNPSPAWSQFLFSSRAPWLY